MKAVLGIDTSCYTTSAALALDGTVVGAARRLIGVEMGGRGLQQSKIVFQHIANMDEIIKQAVDNAVRTPIGAVCASVKPRPVAGSYMPVFTVGSGYGRAIASALDVPFFETTHQEGHIRAALIGTEIDVSHEIIALHLSGGTTELLSVCRSKIECIGGTADLNAGQLVDRVGVALGLPFPAGPHLESLAANAIAQSLIPTSVDKRTCHFSGAEAQVMRMIASGAYAPAAVAAEIFSLLARTIAKLIANALDADDARQVLIFGGVASSHLLKQLLADRLDRLGVLCRIHYAKPEYSGDNAAGAALIGDAALRAD